MINLRVEFKVEHGGVVRLSRHQDFTEILMNPPNTHELPDSIAIIHDNGIVVISKDTPVDVQVRHPC